MSGLGLAALLVLAVVVGMWLAFTVTRLDRLHARVDAAQAALDAQLVRRAAALAHVADWPGSGLPETERPIAERVARTALAPEQDELARRQSENAVGRLVLELLAPPARLDAGAEAEIREAAARVMIARRFYNDAVRDTRALRSRRLPRMLRLAGRRAMPDFFDIDDTLPPRPEPP